MVSKRLEKSVSNKIKLVEQLIRLARDHNIAQLRVGDIVITPNAGVPAVIPFTKPSNKSNVGEPAQQNTIDAMDTALFGSATDYSNI